MLKNQSDNGPCIFASIRFSLWNIKNNKQQTRVFKDFVIDFLKTLMKIKVVVFVIFDFMKTKTVNEMFSFFFFFSFLEIFIV